MGQAEAAVAAAVRGPGVGDLRPGGGGVPAGPGGLSVGEGRLTPCAQPICPRRPG